jgi:3-deoxy-D-manno-octulosonate 8-phosphate phosphatase (KDO 8-P phosphatase)
VERVERTFTDLGGTFCIPVEELRKKSEKIRAYIFDWDGVFNDGAKNETGSSSFGEVDAMGTNLLRFSHYLRHENMPFAAVMSGARNTISFQYGSREHMHGVYFNVKNKYLAFEHFIRQHELRPEAVAFFFDDVLDLSVAASCGLRIMINRKANPLLRDYVLNNKLADYVTAHEGGSFALREACEMIIGVRGNYEAAVRERSHFSGAYEEYFTEREKIPTAFFCWDGAAIVPGTV